MIVIVSAVMAGAALGCGLEEVIWTDECAISRFPGAGPSADETGPDPNALTLWRREGDARLSNHRLRILPPVETSACAFSHELMTKACADVIYIM